MQLADTTLKLEHQRAAAFQDTGSTSQTLKQKMEDEASRAAPEPISLPEAPIVITRPWQFISFACQTQENAIN